MHPCSARWRRSPTRAVGAVQAAALDREPAVQFGGGTFEHHESQVIDWKQIVADLAGVTGEPQRWSLSSKVLYAPPFERWDEEDCIVWSAGGSAPLGRRPSYAPPRLAGLASAASSASERSAMKSRNSRWRKR